MRHKDARTRLKQKPEHARMLKRNLLTSLLLYETVRTTKSRARAVAPMVDRMIRNAKKQTPHVAIRAMNAVLTDKNACRKVMEVLVARYKKRESGLTRTVPLGVRVGDGAQLVELTLLDAELDVPKEATPVVAKTPKKKSTTTKVTTKDA